MLDIVEIDNFFKELDLSEGSAVEKIEKAKEFLRGRTNKVDKKTENFIQRGFNGLQDMVNFESTPP